MRRAALLLLAALLAYTLAASRVECVYAAPLSPPSLYHPLGTDPLGADALCTLSKGFLASLEAGFTGAAAALLVLVAASTASVSIAADRLITLASGVLLGIPGIALFMLLSMLFTLESWQAGLLVGFFAALQAARSVAARAKSVARKPFVEAAAATGAPRTRILLHHILPNIVDVLASYTSMAAAAAVYAEAGLSMLGLTDPSTPSLGRILNLLLNTPGAILTTAGLVQAAASIASIVAVAYLFHASILYLLEAIRV